MKYIILGMLLLILVGCEHTPDSRPCNDLVGNMKYGDVYVVNHGFYAGMTFVAEERESYYSFSGRLIKEDHFVTRTSVDGRSLFEKCKGF